MAELSENQLILLDNLIYLDGVVDQGNVSVGYVVDQLLNHGGLEANQNPDKIGAVDEYPANISYDRWRELLTAISNDSTLSNLTIVSGVDEDTGFRAASFVDESDTSGNNCTVVFRGTHGSFEWHDNGEVDVSDSTQQLRALDYINGLIYDNITVTGHSKGGNKSQYVALLSDKVDRCLSVDGQGFSQLFMEKYQDLIAANSYKITSICAENDFVNCLLTTVAPTIKYISTIELALSNFQNYHCPDLLLDENGNLRAEGEQSALSLFINKFTTFVDYCMPEPLKSYTIDGLIGAGFEKGDAAESGYQKAASIGIVILTLETYLYLEKDNIIDSTMVYMINKVEEVATYSAEQAFAFLYELANTVKDEAIDGFNKLDAFLIESTDYLSNKINEAMNTAGDFLKDLGEDLLTAYLESSIWDKLTAATYKLHDLFWSATKLASPIILDLDGDGIETVAVSNGVHFDFDSNGFSEQSGWTGIDDGLLVRDINSNGNIENGTELFGNETLLKDGTVAANGFIALADYDENKDGKIDQNDSIYSELKVWKDLNQNGVADQGELITLEDAGVKAINTSYINDATIDENGNAHSQKGTYIKADGTVAEATDVWFKIDGINTVYNQADTSTMLEETVDISNLPDIKGLGNVCSLHQAMLQDTSGELKNLVEQFIAETNEETKKNLVVSIVYKWAGVEDVDPTSRGGYLSDARKLEAMEEFFAEEYVNVNYGSNPRTQAAALLENVFTEFTNKLYYQLCALTMFKDLYNKAKLSWNETTQSASIDFIPIADDLIAKINENPEAGKLLLAQFDNNAKMNDLKVDSNFIELRNIIASSLGDEYAHIIDFDGDDKIYGDTNDNSIKGEFGNDNLYGYAGNDILDGGYGNDMLDGAQGNDTYIFKKGYGQDIINDSDSSASNVDVLSFGEGISKENVKVSRSNNNLILTVLNNGVETNDKVTIQNYFYEVEPTATNTGHPYAIETISFVDGSSWSVNDIIGLVQGFTEGDDYIYGNAYGENLNDTFYMKGGNDTVYGNNGNDTLYGEAGNDKIYGDNGDDILAGGVGDDSLNGGSGNDTYIYNIGDGIDTINDFDTAKSNLDVLSFGVGISKENIKVTRSSDNLVLTLLQGGVETGDKVTIKYYFSESNPTETNTGYPYAVETIQFADGSSWSIADMVAMFKTTSEGNDIAYGSAYGENLDDVFHMQAGNDIAYANNGNDTVYGEAGDDKLYGQAGNDTLDGGEGADKLYGDIGNDILIGGVGADYLAGDYGNDTYIYNIGDGTDTIYDYDNSASNIDVLSFGAGISKENIKVTRSSDNLVLTLLQNGVETTDKITIQNYFTENQASTSYSGHRYAVETISFADGSSWSINDVTGMFKVITEGDDLLYSSAYGENLDDVLYMKAGNDTVYANNGNDTVYGEDGNDKLYGDDGNDLLFGGTGEDYITGGYGNDQLYGEDGNDKLYGDYGDDILSGGTGDDTISAGSGNDNLIGGDGADKLYGEDGVDTLNGGTGADYLDGGYGNDTYIYNVGDGADTISDYDFYASNMDVLSFGLGISQSNVKVTRSSNNLVLTILQDGVETGDMVTIKNYFSEDQASATYSGYRNAIETISFADGSSWSINDVVTMMKAATNGDDIAYGSVYGNIDDTFHMLSGNDTVYANNGNDIVYGEAGNDTLNGDAGNDTIFGGEDNDILNGGSGDDILTGDIGDDALFGGSGIDLMDGGAGTDYMEGGSGNDTYVFGVGSGQDTIYDYDTTSGNVDTIMLDANVTTENIMLNRNGSHLELLIKDTSDQLTVSNFFDYDRYKIEKIQFSDGTIWDVATIKDKVRFIDGTNGDDVINSYFDYSQNNTINGFAGNDTISGNSGNDILTGGDGNDLLYGKAGADILDGGAGDDILEGSSGNDTYYYGRGYGQDTINENDSTSGNVDTIQMLGDLQPSDIEIVRIGNNDLGLIIKDSNETIVVNDYFYPYSSSYKVEQVKFNDGTIWDETYIKSHIAYIKGSEADDNTIDGSTGDDIIYGLGGNDIIYAKAGNDTVIGGIGKDQLHGEAGNDTLIGGIGNDSLYGDSGNDTYLFNLGDGQDFIKDYDTTTGNFDKVVFGEGINAADAILNRSGDNLEITFTGKEEKLTINNYFYSQSYKIEQFQFADGTIWDESVINSQTLYITGTDSSESYLYGTVGKNIMTGLGGADHLYGYEGDDTIYGGNDNDILSGATGDDILDGGSGYDSLDGGDGNDTLTGGTGNDSLYGGKGNDTYIFNLGDGQDTIEDNDSTVGNIDTVKFGEGINAADAILNRIGDNLEITFTGKEEKLTITEYFDKYSGQNYKIEQFQFADGTVWDTSVINANTIYVTGTDNNQNLYGTVGENIMLGLGGSDSLYGYEGNDTINGGDGNDTVDGGDGNDSLYGGEGSDSIYGSTGDDLLDGGIGNDYLDGGDGMDTLTGGAGNDSLNGGIGNDTYIFNLGDGQDTISDHDANAGNLDKVIFGEGINPTDAVLNRIGDTLEINFTGLQEKLTISNYFSSHYIIEQFQFADGTVWDDAAIIAQTVYVTGTDYSESYLYGTDGKNVMLGLGGNDHLYGYAGNDTLDGGEGNDTLTADTGDDILFGGAGIDALEGGDGNDTLTGGIGNDNLYGGKGNDTYIFNLGDGQDTIEDNDSTAGNIDIVKFGAGINAADAILKRIGDNLEISFTDKQEKLTITEYFDKYSGQNYKIEQFQFADGTIWDEAAINANTIFVNGTDSNENLYGSVGENIMLGLGGSDSLYGYGGNDTINGGDGNDTVDGGDGNDSLYGGEGSDSLYGSTGDDLLEGGIGNDYLEGGDGMDTLIGGLGKDSLIGGTGNDTYIFNLGDGQDTIYDSDSTTGNIDKVVFGEGIIATDAVLHRIGDALEISFTGKEEKLTITDYFYSQSKKVEQFQFTDGTVWDEAAINAQTIYATGTENNESLYGSTGVNIMTGLGGDDSLYGYAGEDTLTGGEGNDYLDGGEGNDILSGGKGNDTLKGKAGNDTYLFNLGDGQDAIDDGDSTVGNIDVVKFGEGLNATDVILKRVGDNLEITFTDKQEKLTIVSYYYSYSNNKVEQFQFADGTVWDEAAINANTIYVTGTESNNNLYGTTGVNIMTGLGGNDSMYGYAGDDIIDGGDGNDSIDAGDGNDMVYGGQGDDSLTGGAGNDLLEGSVGNDSLNGGDGDDTLTGGAGIDSLTGGAGNDILTGGVGNDTINGGTGNDTYIFNLGDGQDTITDNDSTVGNIDIVKFGDGMVASDAILNRIGDNLEITFTGKEEKLTIRDYYYPYSNNKVEQFQFSDGTVWDEAAINAQTIYVTGTENNENLYGTTGANIMSGLGGSDSLYGYEGNDTIYGGESNDTIDGGVGNDILYGEEGNDSLFGAVGDDILDGGIGSDSLDGGDGNDTLTGGKDNDSLTGGIGNDTYIFNLGDGQDTIYDRDSTTGNLDKVVFGEGISATDAVLKRIGDTLEISFIAKEEKLTINNYFYSQTYKIEQFQFADGTIWDNVAIQSQTINVTGTEYSENNLYGTDGMNIISGLGGSDKLYGYAGDDILNGGTGNDSLDGGDGADTLAGGTGNDSLYGGKGNDTYIFNLGDGQDTIDENDSTVGNIDIVKFGEGFSTAEAVLYRVGDNLEISFTGKEDKLTITEYFDSYSGQSYKIEQFQFADGTIWDEAAINAQPIYTRTGIITNNINGTSGSDTLTGGEGNDIINGGSGNDTYIFNLGGGQDTIIDNDSTVGNIDIVKLGEGMNASDTILSRVGDNLEVTFTGKEEKLIISEYFDSYSGKNYRIEQIQFSDGTVWDETAINAQTIYVTGTGYNESLYGTTGANIISGLGGDDSLYGYAGDDTINGGEDNDYLDGGDGNDTLSGGKGNDTLRGKAGNDIYLFNLGDGQDIIDDGDSTVGNIDVVKFGEGLNATDVILNRVGDNLEVTFTDKQEKLTISSYYYSYSNNKVEQFQFADGTVWDEAAINANTIYVTGTESNNNLYGTTGVNIMSGLGGNDSMYGYAGDDIIDGGDGNDSIDGADGNDRLYGGQGDDSLTGGAGNDLLEGNIGNDSLNGGDDDDTLTGGAGIDALTGGTGNDILTGGVGNDTINGGTGNDTYIFNLGDGQDTITDNDSTVGNMDVVKFGEGIVATDAILNRKGDNLEITFTGKEEKLIIKDYYYPYSNNKVEQFQFADGIVWDEAAINANTIYVTGTENNENLYGTVGNNIMSGLGGSDSLYGYGGNDTLTGGEGNDNLDGGDGNDSLYGGEGSDSLYGSTGDDLLEGGIGNDYLESGSGNDILTGGSGNDSLNGGTGNDTYIFNLVDGQDIITDNDSTVGNIDIVKFGDGMNASDAILNRVGDNLEVTFIGKEEKLTISEYFDSYSGKNYRIEQFQFTDGTIWDEAAINAQTIYVTGTENNENLYGTTGINIISGLGGDDSLYGYAGEDTLTGGEGNDYLDGGEGNDILFGGKGNDTLKGKAGNDTYLFNLGDGQDIIDDGDSTVGNIDVVKFGEGLNATDVILNRVGDNLEITFTDKQEKLTISSYYYSYSNNKVEQFQFADGTVWDEAAINANTIYVTGTESNNSLYGTTGVNIMSGLGGNDSMYGYAGDDIIDGGDGNDSIDAGDGTDIVYGGQGDDSLTGGAGNDLLDGSVGNDFLNGGDGDDTLTGGAGIDNLTGGAGNDILTGGLGNDTISGGTGNDTYIFNLGDGQDTITDNDSTVGNIDIVRFGEGINASDAILNRVGDNLEITFSDKQDKLTVTGYYYYQNVDTPHNVEQFQFADGTVWDQAAINAQTIYVMATENSENLYGTNGANIISGLAGNDSIYGYAGDDIIDGGDDNDYIEGGLGNDILTGGKGIDTILGNTGNDTYIFNLGYGQDTIEDNDSTAGNIDMVKFGEGLNASDVILNRVEDNLEITFAGKEEKLTVTGYYYYQNVNSSYRVEQFQFADGTVWDEAAINAHTIYITETEDNNNIYGTNGVNIMSGLGGNDSMNGYAGDDIIDGGDGNDSIDAGDGNDLVYGGQGDDGLTGGAGNDLLDGSVGNDSLNGGDGIDTLTGETGNDSLTGGAGNDILVGGAGADTMNGGTGNDTYIFNLGDGQDIISENDSTVGNVDVITFGEGINASNTILNRVGDNLEITFADKQEKVTVTDYYYYQNVDTPHNVEQIQFADGTVWDEAVINAQTINVTGTENNESLYGTNGENIISGAGGDDSLYGYAGDDTLAGGTGNDSLDGETGNDTYIFNIGDGVDTITDNDSTVGNMDTLSFGEGITATDVGIYRSDNNLLFTIMGSEDQLTVSNYYANQSYKIETIQFNDGSSCTSEDIDSLGLVSNTSSSELAITQLDLLVQTMASTNSSDGMINTTSEPVTVTTPDTTTEMWVNQ